MAGLDVDRVLDERDPTRRQVHVAIVKRYQELAEMHRKDIAARIANNVRR